MLALVHGSFTALAVPCFATEVQVVSVRPGVSADVVIDGGAPITLRVGGAPVEGVAVVEANRADAVLRVDGTEKALPLSGRESSVAPAPSSDTVTLSADEDGHFVTHGAVNGKTVSFVVDTGATLTTFSRAEAQRVGLDYRRGAPTRSLTANGIAERMAAVARHGDRGRRDIARRRRDGDRQRHASRRAARHELSSPLRHATTGRDAPATTPLTF